MTKIFCDIAELNLIKKFNKKSIVKGFTTNPSLMRKAGAKNYLKYCKKILKIVKKKPLSFEVFGDNYKDIIEQATKINIRHVSSFQIISITKHANANMKRRGIPQSGRVTLRKRTSTA